MDYSYYDEDEEERRWGRGGHVRQQDRLTLQERMRMQKTMTMGNGMGRGSDSRSTTPPGSRLRMPMAAARSSRDVSEAESDFSSPSKKMLRVRL